MNAMLATANFLPAAIMIQHRPGQDRRRCVGGFCLDPTAVEAFNAFLELLGRDRDPIDCDQLSTAARELCDCDAVLAAACIGVRMRRAALVDRMIADPGWGAGDETCLLGSTVVEYIRRHDDLIPDTLPRVGRLDDALVVDTAWPRLAEEAAGYTDFRRLRRIEARLRGRDPGAFSFNRADWLESRRAEAALASHRARVRDSAYVPAPAAAFRVH